jgi:hypothetical protein
MKRGGAFISVRPKLNDSRISIFTDNGGNMIHINISDINIDEIDISKSLSEGKTFNGIGKLKKAGIMDILANRANIN